MRLQTIRHGERIVVSLMPAVVVHGTADISDGEREAVLID